MTQVMSKDGTPIGFERTGSGPALILVDGALCYREFGPMRPLAALLAPRFTVYIYDRRGRGESGDTAPYAVEREVEDIDALVREAGGSALVYGTSSGAVLALEAAASGVNITRLALYEPPYRVDSSRPSMAPDYATRFDTLLAEGRRGDMVEHFMVDGVGMPAEIAAQMRNAPVWPMMETLAPTLINDTALLERHGWRPTPEAQHVRMPTLLMYGEASPPWALAAQRALGTLIPHAHLRGLPGQTHDAAAEAVAPALIEFFSSQNGTALSSDLPVNLAAPAHRALVRAGILRLEQIATYTELQLTRLHGMGPRAIEQLRAALQERGLSFASQEEEDQV